MEISMAGRLCALALACAAIPASAQDYTRPQWWPSPWGADDQRGALNRLTPAKVLEAAALTLVLSCAAMLLAVVLGVAIATGRVYGDPVTRAALTVYVEVMRGTPDGYRHMDGFGSHTFSLINDAGERVFVKWHLRTPTISSATAR